MSHIPLKRIYASIPDGNFKPSKKIKNIDDLKNDFSDDNNEPESNFPSSESSSTISSASQENSNDVEKTTTPISPFTTDSDQEIHISKKLMLDYGPRLREVHELWHENTMKVMANVPSHFNNENPLEWSIDTVCEYIESLPRCHNIAKLFREQEIDGAALLSLNQSDLTATLNIKLGPAIKIYNQIIYLREQSIKYLL